ncbi:leukocyte elastase inhibitor-like [Anoplopoma fimbria]|uniref:leukocyte elastase inhibitor-like n=1 Tax=Anoplopoma fimbria TaxID=229290 RepID=UPI0023EB8DFB|nr:leukocyte elastase inhibitor-like [Anoplopoma fimbria]
MASPTPLSKANTTFSLALLKKFGDDNKTANVFFSPFSISSALAMVMLGARGNSHADNDTKSVKMMSQTDKFPVTSIPEANCQILEMFYEGKELSMLIILPNEIEDDTTGLEKLERELTYEKFEEWTRSDMMGQTQVEVRLPRFKMEEEYDLKDVLISMGMVDAFDVTRSDLSGMSPANDLVVSKVVHKAFVEVNEEGTEAAAATGVIIAERSIIIPATFIADHPFLFFIRHNPTKTVLFSGRYCSPQ